MPTYDYVCAACGHAFEQFQAMSDKKLLTCPRCKKRKLERQVGTGAGLIFKGTGFYITDYRRGGGADAATPSVDGKKAEGKRAEGNEAKGARGNGGDSPAPAAPSAADGQAKADAPKPAPKPSKGGSGK